MDYKNIVDPIVLGGRLLRPLPLLDPPLKHAKMERFLRSLSRVYTIMAQWRSQDLILGGGGKNNVRGSEATEPERAEQARGGGGGGRVWCPPSHSESFLHFDVGCNLVHMPGIFLV